MFAVRSGGAMGVTVKGPDEKTSISFRYSDLYPGKNALFNDALNTFYLQLYGIGHMVEDHSDSVKGNLLLPLHGLLFPVSSKEFSICTIPQTG